MTPSPGLVHRAAWRDLEPQTLHDLVRLRIDVFVVEQACAYPELDGRDTEVGTEHWWTADEDGPSSCLRVLVEPDGARRVGRVATRADCRGRGLARRLMTAVLAAHGSGPLVLDAQTPVQAFYAGLGFEASGPEFVEDAIAHLPMRRLPLASGAAAGQGGPMSDYSAERPLDVHPLNDTPAETDPAVDPAVEDLDLESVDVDQDPSGRDDPDRLVTDGLQPADDEDAWEPPERAPGLEQGETLDERLAEEEPEPDPRAAGQRDADRDLLES